MGPARSDIIPVRDSATERIQAQFQLGYSFIFILIAVMNLVVISSNHFRLIGSLDTILAMDEFTSI